MEVLDPVVRTLRECGVPLETQEQRTQLTPLHRAVALGQVELFGNYRDCVDKQDAFGLTPLHIAVMTGNMDAVRDLTQLGANPCIQDKTQSGYSALHLACKHGNIEMVRVLLSCKGVNIDQASMRHGTALHLACRSQNLPIVRLLVELGADVNAQDSNSSRPLHLLALEFISTRPEDSTPFLSALAADAKLEPNARDQVGRTPLHCACLTGNKIVAEFLMKNLKADVNAKDKSDRTPLHYAVCGLCVGADSGLGAVVRPLIQSGADIFAKDKHGLVALELLNVIHSSRRWTKGEATALAVAQKVLLSAEEEVAKAAQAEAMANQLLQEESTQRSSRPRTKKK